MDDWGELWELPDYPKLPKLFTSAKTAKKRKHKEYIVTDELLQQPVKLPKQGNADRKSIKQQQQPQAVALQAKDAAATADTTAPKPKDHRAHQARGSGISGPITAAAEPEDVVATDKKKQKKHNRNRPEGYHEAGTHLQRAGQQHQEGKAPSLLQTGETVVAAAASGDKKVKEHKKQEPDAVATALTGAADTQGTAVLKLPKKSKNKFKQPEFLQQRQLQQQQSNRKQEVPSQPREQNEQHQQQAEAAEPAVTDAAKRASKKSSKSKQASSTSDTPAVAAGNSLQQQQQVLAAASKPVTKLRVFASSTATSPASRQKTPAGGSKQKAPAAVRSVAAATNTAPASKQKTPASSSGGSKLLQQFKERLQGSRFRQLNEALYTQPGDESFAMLQEQPELFEQYHEGFQQQVKSWPAQPLDAAIAWLASKPESMVVADFGCGDARLAATVKQQVHSLDLVANAPGVIACNMAHTPLERNSCDAAVFSLALMGVDYGEFLVEAARIVKQGGWLWIAEVRSRFTGSSGTEDFKPFLNCLQQLGCKLVKQDAKNRLFVVFVLKKQQQIAAAEAESIKWPALKACVYKKR